MSEKNIGPILGGIAAVITALTGIYALVKPSISTTNKENPETEIFNRKSKSDISISLDGLWEAQNNGTIREIEMIERGLKIRLIKDRTNWYHFDKVSTNTYQRKTSNDGQVKIIVIDRNQLRRIEPNGREFIWIKK